MRKAMGIVALVVGCAPGSETAATMSAPRGMVRVEGQSFLMGTDSSAVPAIMGRYNLTRREILAAELNQHEVTVSDFFLDPRDVTNGEFAEFVRAQPEWSRAQVDTAFHNGRYLVHWDHDGPATSDLDRPVTFVTWYAAVAFCDWLGKRLPTEPEWELAAGGGDPAIEFPWGQDLPSNEVVSWSGGGHERPMPVASYPPTGLGFYDLSGNVWKFLADPWSGSYAETAQKMAEADSLTTADTLRVRRVVRGGSYGASVVNLRVRYRDSHRPFDAREMVGFRCARSADGA